MSACASTGSQTRPKGGTPPSRSTITQQPAPKPAAPRWQAKPARADGKPVPGGRRHVVKSGETGIAIARAYNVPWSRIAAANRIDREATLYVGQALFVPTGEASAQPPRSRPPSASATASRPGATPEEQAAAFQLDVDDLITGSAPAGAARPPVTTAGAAALTPRPAPAAAVPSLSWPVDGRVVLSRYGAKPNGRFNDGVNIKTLRGAAVRAAADGEVIYVGDAIAGFGLMMLVRHAGGTVTAYAHLEDALADRGDRVQRGQPIARAGTSGEVTEPQLHFQLRQGRRTLDPMIYLPR
jgi:murein DD-endopeptidase MepM/ murein hydrolase activator NlpD